MNNFISMMYKLGADPLLIRYMEARPLLQAMLTFMALGFTLAMCRDGAKLVSKYYAKWFGEPKA